ncbi:MAG: hypothetical protein PUP46_11150, partial [Endozoicomonas sp. (ex Botrylloides leachii)]|nr:hypothetical protein [Endozoicomonas sp. (ex Botrylloides leachii)]
MKNIRGLTDNSEVRDIINRAIKNIIYDFLTIYIQTPSMLYVFSNLSDTIRADYYGMLQDGMRDPVSEFYELGTFYPRADVLTDKKEIELVKAFGDTHNVYNQYAYIMQIGSAKVKFIASTRQAREKALYSLDLHKRMIPIVNRVIKENKNIIVKKIPQAINSDIFQLDKKFVFYRKPKTAYIKLLHYYSNGYSYKKIASLTGYTQQTINKKKPRLLPRFTGSSGCRTDFRGEGECLTTT